MTFLGPSGCGKTTMLRTLAGFLHPDQGTIHVGGPADVVAAGDRPAGNAPHGHGVPELRGVAAHVACSTTSPSGCAARVPGAEIADARRAHARRGRPSGPRATGIPGSCRGGQQQRVALARSLVVEPSILLLDEPLSNLDAKLRERMRIELKTLQRRTGITFVYVTHDQAEAMALSDRIVVFNKGVVQQVGTPRDVYERPANLFVADFMGLVNKLPGDVVGRSGDRARCASAGRSSTRA